MPTSATWSKDRVTQLTALWRDGLSAAQIAARLGQVTRNAVIGKLHRLGLARSDARAAAVSARRREPRPAKVATEPRRRERALAPVGAGSRSAPVEAVGLAADLDALDAHACRWPIGDPKARDFSFCGRPAQGPYCPHHAELSRGRSSVGVSARGRRQPLRR